MLNQVKKETIEDRPLKIGTLLINEGLIRNTDLDRAVEIQEKEIRQAELPIGKLLVKKKLIDRNQLQSLLQHPELINEIETYAIEKARVKPEDLAECIAKKPRRQPLAEALVSTGHLTNDDLKRFFEKQIDSLKICELAVETGMVSESDMARVLQSQQPTTRTIGEILCDLNLVSPLDLNAVLTKYRKHLGLGEILLKHGFLKSPELDMAIEAHERSGEPVTNILQREGILSEDQLYNAFSLQHNIPFERLEGFEYSAGQRDVLTKIVGKVFADQFHLVPVHLEDNTLTVALSDPEDIKTVHALRSKRVDLRTKCFLVTPSTMQHLYIDLYGTRPPFPVPDRIESPGASPIPIEKTPKNQLPVKDARHTEPPAHAARKIEPSPSAVIPDTHPQPGENAIEKTSIDNEVIKLVNRLLREATSRGARAIHIDQGLRRTSLRLRIGETLEHPSRSWPDDIFQEMSGRVINTVKKIAGMDTGSHHRPQEGMFRAGMSDPATGTADLDFTVTSCPTLAGENLIIRRISPFSPAPDLGELSHSRHVVTSLKQVMKQPSGLFLVASPPGNGRTATLYAMLKHILEPGKKAVTVDDTIPFSMPDAVQTQANASGGLPYADLLRTALRLDPDVILAEDLGTSERIHLGIEGVQKGVLLLGGIPAADAAGAVSNMNTLGRVAWTSGLFKAVLAQQYVRKICGACKQPYTPSPEEWQPLFEQLPDGLEFYRGSGCPECGFSGYRGKVLLSELLVISDVIVRAMKQQLPAKDIRHLIIRSGAKTLIDDGLSKLDQTTLSEIVDAVPEEATEAFKCNRADTRMATSPGPAPEKTPASEKEKKDTTEKKANFEIILSSGVLQKAGINQLHHAYEVVMEETGRRSRPSNSALFETFIKAHHSAICRRFGCSQVAFSVGKQTGKALLLATPLVH